MKLGFIGVGNMGGPMCGNLIKHDHQVVVHDLSPEARQRYVKLGASEAPTAREVTAQTDVVFTSLPGPPEISAVVLGKDGIVEGAHADTIFVDLSTNSPSLARSLAAELEGKGIPMVDAPVSGGTTGAAAGTVSVMVGGKKEIFDKVEPLLKCIGKNIYHVGDHGAGCTVKLINNMLAFINQFAAGEGFMLGIRAGIDPKILHEVISTSSGNSNALDRIATNLLTGDFAPTFALELAHKDLRLALQLGEETGTPLSMGSLLVNNFRLSTARGDHKLDVMAMMKLIEDNMGTDVRYLK